MADIEFKRRGTPLWLVLLVLLGVGGGAFYAFGREDDPAAAPATAAAPAAPAARPADSAAVAPAPLPAPAGNTGAAADFVRYVEGRRFPASGAAAQRAYVSEAVRLLAGVVERNAPSSGQQILMLRAVADTLALAETKPEKVADLTQLAFFAFGQAMGGGPLGEKLSQQAGLLQVGAPLGEQASAVRAWFDVARDIVKNPSQAVKGDSVAAGAAR